MINNIFHKGKLIISGQVIGIVEDVELVNKIKTRDYIGSDYSKVIVARGVLTKHGENMLRYLIDNRDNKNECPND